MVVIGGGMRRAQVGAIAGYGASASFAEDIISSIRNVAAYGSQSRFLAKYNASLAAPAALDFRAKAFLGLFIGTLMWMQMSGFALSFWQGSRFMADGVATVSQILTATLAMSISAVNLGNSAPYIGAFVSASAAAGRILATISRKPPIALDSGITLEGIEGEIDFEGVKLVYPSRKGHVVLEDFNLKIPAGKITAVVGPSGSGKSTLVSLLQRFYAPLSGGILVDGRDISDLNLRWLRGHIGLVGQEPFLFNTTVFENIAYGLVGSEHENVSCTWPFQHPQCC